VHVQGLAEVAGLARGSTNAPRGGAVQYLHRQDAHRPGSPTSMRFIERAHLAPQLYARLARVRVPRRLSYPLGSHRALRRRGSALARRGVAAMKDAHIMSPRASPSGRAIVLVKA
jgi:hypothetical protein